MDDPKAHSIGEITRVLPGNAEQQAVAGRLLEELDLDDSAIARLKNPVRCRWKWLLYGMLTLVSGWVLFGTVHDAFRYKEIVPAMFGTNHIDFFHYAPEITEEEFAGGLAPDQRRLLFGDLAKSPGEERMKALWDSAPENPAYFAEYAAEFIKTNDSLPPDFLAIAGRIDPGNSWFTYVAAGTVGMDSVKSRNQTPAEKAAFAPLQWDIINPAAFQESLDLLSKARSQPEFRNPLLALHREQMTLIPRSTPSEWTFAISYAFGKSAAMDYAMGKLGMVIAAKAWVAAERNEAWEFQKIHEDASDLIRKSIHSETGSASSEFVLHNAFGTRVVTNLAHGSKKLGLDDPALDRSLVEANRIRAVRKRSTTPELEYRGGRVPLLLAAGSIMNLSPPITPDESRPSRLMDHETVSWEGSQIAWAILIVSLAAWALIRFLIPPPVRWLGSRLETLIQPSDWMWIFSLGVLIPWCSMLAILRLTPLGGRDFSIFRNQFEIPFSDSFPLGLFQFAALAGILMTAPAIVARWRIHRRLPFPRRAVWWALAPSTAAIAAVGFILMAGWSVVHSSDSVRVAAWSWGGISGISLLLTFASVLLSSAGPWEILLTRLTTPALAFAAILMISLAPWLKAEAFKWSAKDPLLRLDPDYPGDIAFNHRIALKLREETRGIFGE